MTTQKFQSYAVITIQNLNDKIKDVKLEDYKVEGYAVAHYDGAAQVKKDIEKLKGKLKNHYVLTVSEDEDFVYITINKIPPIRIGKTYTKKKSNRYAEEAKIILKGKTIDN